MNLAYLLDPDAVRAALAATTPVMRSFTVFALIWALWPLRRTWKGIVVRLLVVAAVFVLVPLTLSHERVLHEASIKAWVESRERARAHFLKRCESAGEFIHRRVQGVDSIWWMKRRFVFDQMSQYKLQDPYGHDCSDTECARQLLRLQGPLRPTVDIPTYLDKHGFLFVEAEDAQGKLQRFRKIVAPRKPVSGEPPGTPVILDEALDVEEIDKPRSRYGVTWEDISEPVDRDQWIAGGALRVIDLQTNEVIAERIGYMWDEGMGGGIRDGRQPWGFAELNSCPRLGSDGISGGFRVHDGTLRFLRRVLFQSGLEIRQ